MDLDLYLLANLASGAAAEVDFFITGEPVPEVFADSAADLATILKEHQISDTTDWLTLPAFPYEPLIRAIDNTSGQKGMQQYSELALRMHLLSEDLANVRMLEREKAKSLRGFCVELSKQFSAEQDIHGFGTYGLTG